MLKYQTFAQVGKSLKRFYSYNVLFFGSDRFSLYTLKKLSQSNLVKNLEVVCPPDALHFSTEPQPVPVKKFALQQGIPVHHPNSETTLKNFEIPKNNFDIGIVVSFRYFVPSRIIKQFPVCAFNVHPSLLPRHRGGAPIHHTLLRGDKETAVSIIELHPQRMDCGRILNQSDIIKIPETVMFNQLYHQLGEIGGELTLDTLEKMEYYKNNAREQSNEGATLAPNIKKEMGKIDFEKDGVMDVYNKWRAFSENIKVYTFIDGKMVLLREVLHPSQYTIPDELNHYNYETGIMVYDKMQRIILLKMKDGWIGISKLQRDGRKVVTAKAFSEPKALDFKTFYECK